MVLFSKLSPPWHAKYCGITHLSNKYKGKRKPSKLSVMDKVVGRSCVKMSMSKNKKKTKKGIWGDQDNLISNNLNAKPGNNE